MEPVPNQQFSKEERTMKKWLISLLALTLAVAATTAVTFAVVGNGSGASEQSSPSGADQPSHEVREQYEVMVKFNTSVTQGDIDDVTVLLRTHDDDLDFVIMESFPPIGHAVLTIDATDFCPTVEAELETRSYIEDISCGPSLGSRCGPEGPPPCDPSPTNSDEAPAEGEYCSDTETNAKLSHQEAVEIAQNSECVEHGQLKETRLCNPFTGTWWIDLDVDKPGCSPACVVNVSEKTAEINWRCTGLLPPTNSDEAPAPVGPTSESSDTEVVDYLYDVTVHFNTSATQDDIDEVAALLRTYDQNAELLMTFCHPPMGTALVTTDVPDFCRTVEAELEAKSYVDEVSCGRCMGSRCGSEGTPPGDTPPVHSDEAPVPADPGGEPSDAQVVDYLYDVTVHFNTSATQDDIDEVAALLRTYDDELEEFVVMESFPPVGRALLKDGLNLCPALSGALEGKSYVDDVSCEPMLGGCRASGPPTSLTALARAGIITPTSSA
jgi:hypothetical protein